MSTPDEFDALLDVVKGVSRNAQEAQKMVFRLEPSLGLNRKTAEYTQDFIDNFFVDHSSFAENKDTKPIWDAFWQDTYKAWDAIKNKRPVPLFRHHYIPGDRIFQSTGEKPATEWTLTAKTFKGSDVNMDD